MTRSSSDNGLRHSEEINVWIENGRLLIRVIREGSRAVDTKIMS